MAQTQRFNVMVVDDHPIVRDGLREVLRHCDDFEVVGQARDGVAAVEMAPGLRPDVIIMDVVMPNKDGIEACREIMQMLPDTRVLILTVSNDQAAVVEALAAGATGYVIKDTGREDLLKALREVVEGRLWIPVDLLQQTFALIRGDSGTQVQPVTDNLTAREKEILALFASGRSYRQIAEVLPVSSTTVRNFVYRIQDKLGVGTKQEMVVWAVRSGLLDDVGYLTSQPGEYGGSSKPAAC